MNDGAQFIPENECKIRNVRDLLAIYLRDGVRHHKRMRRAAMGLGAAAAAYFALASFGPASLRPADLPSISPTDLTAAVGELPLGAALEAH